MQLYGWDSRTELWHGPNEFGTRAASSQPVLNALCAVSGKSWYGPVNCSSAGEPPARFFAIVHDLSDCAVATIYCDESKTGPAEILAVLPPERRPLLRAEFAFEFLAFARFLASVSAGAELQLCNGIDMAIADASGPDTLVFSVSSGMWPCDQDYHLSQCVEKIAVALRQWLRVNSSPIRCNGSRT
jgi:hypothetical protein